MNVGRKPQLLRIMVSAYWWQCTTFSYYLVPHMHATMNKTFSTGVTPHPSVPRLKKVYSHTTTPLWAFIACSRLNLLYLTEVTKPSAVEPQNHQILNTECSTGLDICSFLYKTTCCPSLSKIWMFVTCRTIPHKQKRVCFCLIQPIIRCTRTQMCTVLHITYN